MSSIGDKVRFWREKKGISQRELARRSGLHYVHVAKIELGQRPDPAISTMQAIAKALGITLDKLLNPPKERG